MTLINEPDHGQGFAIFPFSGLCHLFCLLHPAPVSVSAKLGRKCQETWEELHRAEGLRYLYEEEKIRKSLPAAVTQLQTYRTVTLLLMHVSHLCPLVPRVLTRLSRMSCVSLFCENLRFQLLCCTSEDSGPLAAPDSRQISKNRLEHTLHLSGLP